VWVFGGSAAFGYGTQRDEHTIASDIARRAEADGVRIRVRNFAYPGYQNYQETLKLSQLLATGGRPDVVIFYDGYNNRMFDAGRLLLGDFGATSFSHINYATVVDLLAKSADIEIPPSRGVNIGRPVDPEQLAPQLVAMYRSGIDLAQHLAKGYGFTVIHTYQPDIFAKRLEGDEDKVLQAFGYDDQMVRAERKLSTEVRKTMPPEVVDLSDVFDDTREPVMANLVHTNEQGAVIIADAIWPLVEPHVTN
jgi:lysophospholipase L1-like esterase